MDKRDSDAKLGFLGKPGFHGGVCSSVLDTNPRGVGGGSRRGGGGGSKNFLHFGGHFWIPHFFLSILNIHKWGEIWFYHSQQMKNSTIFQQM